jgi:hypothetical protein
VLRLLVTANVVPSSPILVTLKTEETLSSEISALTRATRRNIHVSCIHGYCASYIAETASLNKLSNILALLHLVQTVRFEVFTA